VPLVLRVRLAFLVRIRWFSGLVLEPPNQSLEFFLVLLVLRSWFLCHVNEVFDEMYVR
jgi:hypothetical protein